MRVIVNGALGRMGKTLTGILETAGHEIAAKVDANGDGAEILRDFSACPKADVIIDFSHHTAVNALLDYAEAANIPAVVCTTGHTEEELARIRAAAEKVAVFHSGNMSVGVALLCELARKTAQVFPEADVEIVETHHKHKLDAPSGTAKMLFSAVQEVRAEAEMQCGRSGICPRRASEVGMHSLRMGEIVGIHEVIVSTGTQTITLKHEAHSRALFAEGAVCAAEFLKDQSAGLYNMKSMI